MPICCVHFMIKKQHTQTLSIRCEKNITHTAVLHCGYTHTQGLLDRQEFLTGIIEEFESIRLYDFYALDNFKPFITQHLNVCAPAFVVTVVISVVAVAAAVAVAVAVVAAAAAAGFK